MRIRLKSPFATLPNIKLGGDFIGIEQMNL
jgi:hypothetical protein